jgi:hypothetical protein
MEEFSKNKVFPVEGESARALKLALGNLFAPFKQNILLQLGPAP